MCTSRPSNRTSPLSGVCVRATHLIGVDLPAPLSPTSAITSPRRTSKSTSSSACTEPNVFVMPRSSRRGVSVTVARFLTRWRGRRLGRRLPRGSFALLAVLLVLPDADLAPLQEPVREEPLVVRLRDPDDRDRVGRL